MLGSKQEVLQGFQSVNIQAEEIKTSLLGAQMAGKQIDRALNKEKL
jgi:ribosomal protein L12E/L44/L45/RPP1/RPP2